MNRVIWTSFAWVVAFAIGVAAFAFAAAGQAQALTVGAQAGAEIAAVDLHANVATLNAGQPAWTIAESDEVNYKLYDEYWATDDGAEVHWNEAEQAKVAKPIESVEAGVVYYYTVVFTADDGYVFSDDVALVTAGQVVSVPDEARQITDDGKKLTFYRYYSTVGVDADGANELDLSEVKLSWKKKQYNGQVQVPTVKGTVYYNGREAEKGTEYNVRYSASKSKKAGVYTVVVEGDNMIGGSKTLVYRITPKGTSLSKLTAGKKCFTAKWAKQATQADGYEVEYALNSKFTKSAQTLQFGKKQTSGKVAKGVKAKKKYY
ncbi:MAG: hypothetical protein IJ131_08170, partial [Eggerthellaceae bacterium]|nr:hypothetical protein [Eggerthellaceae bacterium]